MMPIRLALVLSALCCTAISAQPLIPMPRQLDSLPGNFRLTKSAGWWLDAAFGNAELLKSHIGSIQPATKWVKASKAQIRIKKLPATGNYHPEFYSLEITNRRISIAAYTDTGVYRALTTFSQLLPVSHAGTPSFPLTLKCMRIQDQPAYVYRGLHLDVCRHFFDVAFIKSYIDAMAAHKYNVFHWHLTEDQGWRIEIKQYPQLTETGAWRSGSQKGRYREQRFDSVRYGGYYTQDQIREIVRYAQDRYITVIPEIEMPGHSLAALAAYPRLSCTGGPFQVAKGWGVFDDVYCAGNDSTLLFLRNVLDEVMALFPSAYIHIGGDECPKTRWKTCPRCQARIKSEGLKDEHELQSWFIRSMEQYLNSHGRQIIGWDEILEGGLAPNATVMSWRGTEGGIAAARMHHRVVMTPGKPCYFDHYQSKDSTEPIAIGGYNPLEAVYQYKPMPAELDSSLRPYILGAQGNVWTEYMETEDHVEYMVWPRAAALSEVLWTGKSDDYAGFLRRLQTDALRLEFNGINVAPHFRIKP